MKLAFAIVVALVFSSLQCVASCASLNMDPPCHHHGHSMDACSHEIVMDRAPEAVSAVPCVPPVEAVALIMATGAISFEPRLVAVSFFAPPRLTLRI
ncbi:MAG: hypothetical protein ACRD30_01885 [Bryobacteraceae bacterium]